VSIVYILFADVFFGGCVHTELIESCMYLYQATKDPFLLEVAVEILEAIEHNAKTLCGYATVS